MYHTGAGDTWGLFRRAILKLPRSQIKSSELKMQPNTSEKSTKAQEVGFEFNSQIYFKYIWDFGTHCSSTHYFI